MPDIYYSSEDFAHHEVLPPDSSSQTYHENVEGKTVVYKMIWPKKVLSTTPQDISDANGRTISYNWLIGQNLSTLSGLGFWVDVNGRLFEIGSDCEYTTSAKNKVSKTLNCKIIWIAGYKNGWLILQNNKRQFAIWTDSLNRLYVDWSQSLVVHERIIHDGWMSLDARLAEIRNHLIDTLGPVIMNSQAPNQLADAWRQLIQELNLQTTNYWNLTEENYREALAHASISIGLIEVYLQHFWNKMFGESYTYWNETHSFVDFIIKVCSEQFTKLDQQLQAIKAAQNNFREEMAQAWLNQNSPEYLRAQNSLWNIINSAMENSITASWDEMPKWYVESLDNNLKSLQEIFAVLSEFRWLLNTLIVSIRNLGGDINIQKAAEFVTKRDEMITSYLDNFQATRSWLAAYFWKLREAENTLVRGKAIVERTSSSNLETV